MDEFQGPDRRNLQGVFGMLPTLSGGLSEGSIGGKGRKVSVPQKTVPRKICPLCLKQYDKAAAPSDTVMKSEPCEKCQAQLDDGWTAAVCGEKCFWLKHASLGEYSGKIISVSLETMDQIEAKYGEKRKSEEADGGAAGPTG